MKLVRRFSIRGQPLLQAVLNELADAINARTPRKYPGCMVQEKPDGFTYRPLKKRAGGGGAGGSAPVPWGVIAEAPDESGDPQVSVELDSWLMGSLRCDHKITVTGLGAPFVLAATPNLGIWLEVAFDAAGAVSGATLEHGTLWANYPSPIRLTAAGASQRQDRAYALIAHTRTIDASYPDRIKLSETVEVMQNCTTHLRLCRDCYQGNESLKVIVPHMAPGPVLA